MSATRSSQLVFVVPPANTLTLAYIVPGNVIALVKSFIIDGTALAADAQGALGFLKPSGVHIRLFTGTIAHGAIIDQQCWHVLEPGDAIQVFGTLDGCAFMVSGAELV